VNISKEMVGWIRF